MAQGDSIVGICNAALVSIGEDMIASLTDPSKQAALCALKYDQVRREVLASQPWACAMKSAQLAAATQSPPLTQYDFAYPLPADCLRVFNLPDNDSATWEIQNPFGTGKCLMTDEQAPLDVLYVFDLQDPTIFDAALSRAISKRLAHELAPALTQSDDKEDRAAKKAEDALDDARLNDNQQASPKEWDEDIWLRSRV